MTSTNTTTLPRPAKAIALLAIAGATLAVGCTQPKDTYQKRSIEQTNTEEVVSTTQEQGGAQVDPNSARASSQTVIGEKEERDFQFVIE